jgi:hypothetical protein
MKTIYKYALELTDRQAVSMPIGSKILYVGNQNGTICVWAEVDSDVPYYRDHEFRIVGTGNPIDFPTKPNETVWQYNFIGTVIMNPFVWHVYWR